jgi:hypothetical protein
MQRCKLVAEASLLPCNATIENNGKNPDDPDWWLVVPGL